MQADTLRLLFTYLIATVVIVGGGAALLVVRNDPNSADLQIVFAGFIGAAIQFVFNKETQTSTSIQTTNAVVKGQQNPT